MAPMLGWGDKQPVLVAVDLGSGQPLALGYINEHNPQAVRRWLASLVQQHGITVIVSDDLSSYKIVAEKLQLGHQICQFHVRRWVGKAKSCGNYKKPSLKNGSGPWRTVILSSTCCLPMAARPCMPFGRSSLGIVPRPARLALPWTNNATQRAIGRMKMRARTVRG
jgi:hypothetical protein